MRTHACSTVASSSVLGAIIIAAPSLCLASGFQLLEQSSAGLGSAFAGIGALAEDPSTVFFNSAGLTRLDKPMLATSVTGINISTKFHNNASTAAVGQTLGSQGGQAGDLTFLPAIYGSLPINKTIALGLGLNVPFGLKTEYDSDWMGRFQATKSEVKTLNVNPAIAFKLGEYVSLGVGADFQHIQAELASAVNYTAVIGQVLGQRAAAGQLPGCVSPATCAAVINALLTPNAGLQGTSKVRGDDSAWGFDAGILFDLPSKTRIGLAYRSGINYTVEGTVKFAAPATSNPVGAPIIAGASAPGAALSSGPAQLHIKLPAIARASFVQPLGSNLNVLADVSWTQWSNIQQLAIKRPTGIAISTTPEHWRDTWRYALGVSYALNNAWKLRAGVAYDEAPVPDSTRTPRLPDIARKWASVGAQWHINNVADLDAGYAHLFLSDAKIHQDNGSASAYGLLDGVQRTSIDILGVQLSVKF
jgi:long-chain fatty acid transport protein